LPLANRSVEEIAFVVAVKLSSESKAYFGVNISTFNKMFQTSAQIVLKHVYEIRISVRLICNINVPQKGAQSESALGKFGLQSVL